jgi:hypothetical protein
MTQTEAPPVTGLARREFSDQQIRTRLDAAKSTKGYGLESASVEQINMVFLLAQHYDVDPAVDITLYQGRPWFTIDGRVRLMRRHPQYRGYRTRPQPPDEKMLWGYKPDEIVVECCIQTRDWGEITARGKVMPDEFARQPVAKAHPQEMAEKRAIARASRMAFGQDVPDEDDAGIVIEERNDPERIATNAAEYDRIFPSEAVEVAALPPQPAPTPWRTRAQMRARYEQLAPKARELGVEVPSPPGRDSSEEEAERWLKELEDRIHAEEERLLTFGTESEDQRAVQQELAD